MNVVTAAQVSAEPREMQTSQWLEFGCKGSAFSPFLQASGILQWNPKNVIGWYAADLETNFHNTGEESVKVRKLRRKPKAPRIRARCLHTGLLFGDTSYTNPDYQPFRKMFARTNARTNTRTKCRTLPANVGQTHYEGIVLWNKFE